MTNDEYLNFLMELQELEEDGVRFDVDDNPATPVDVVHAHMVRESCSYMRDYIPGDKGSINKIKFNKIED